MARFIIASENRITRIASDDANHDGKTFATKEQLTKLSTQWTGQRLVQIWNEMPGVKPVHKFTDRKTGIDRIWDALQHSYSEASPSAARPERANNREGSKSAEILKLLRRPAGATLENLMNVTGWQAHSVRGFISAAVGKKMGLQVASSRRKDGQPVGLQPYFFPC